MPAVKKKRSKQKSPSVVERVAAIFERYPIAGIAGSGVIVGLIGLVLWAGGYFGMIGTSINRAVGGATIAVGLEVKRVLLKGAHQTAHEEVVEALGPVLGGPILQVFVRLLAIQPVEQFPGRVAQVEEGSAVLIDQEPAVFRNFDTWRGRIRG